MQQGLFIFLIVFLPLLIGCGRKQRSIFVFPSEKSSFFHKLEFRAPKILSVKQINNVTLIKWLEPELPKHVSGVRLIGYNVYELTQHGFIPKNPCNDSPITGTSYQKAHFYCHSPQYAVRALFDVEKKVYEGPLSNIVKKK